MSMVIKGFQAIFISLLYLDNIDVSFRDNITTTSYVCTTQLKIDEHLHNLSTNKLFGHFLLFATLYYVNLRGGNLCVYANVSDEVKVQPKLIWGKFYIVMNHQSPLTMNHKKITYRITLPQIMLIV